MANSQPVKIEILMVDKLSSNMEKSQRKVKELKQHVATANKELENTERISDRLSRSVGKLAGAFAIKELVANATQVRGQFQQLEVAFTTMLQSGEKADALLQQLTKTAATTPFGLEDVAQGAKQLLAYGLGAEKVNETLIRLGDIAAGLSVPLNDLVYLYGTTMAQGRLYTQDLNQFTGRGIRMISELAKQFGVAESKVKELVESGKVGFPEVQKVIESLTNEGGKFGGLMEEQSKTITGQISNIEDSISVMFNELGQQSEGIINSTLSGISYVTEHYERFGRILLALVSTYGTYRTAIMLVTAAKGWATAAEALHYNWLLLVEKAQKMLNATMLANPYVLVATLISGVVVAMVSMKTEAERMKEADEAYENQKQKVIEAEEAHKRRLEELAGVAGDEALSTDTRREALNKLEQKYPDIFAKYDTEIEKLQHIKKIKEEIAALEGQKSITRPENEVKDVNKRIAELEKKGAATYSAQSTIWGGYTYQNGGRTKDEEAELQSLYRRRDVLKGKIRQNSVNSYFENLTGVSNETLEQQIKQRENLLARMMTNEKKYGTITQGDSNLRGTYSRDELQYQLNKLRAEQNERNAPRNSGSGWASKAKEDYDKALKAYNDFVSDKTQKLTAAEFEKRRKELKDDLDQKKKEYDKVKPSKDSDSEKASKQHQKEQAEAERRKQTQEKLGQELAELQRSNDAAEIKAMEEGLQKKLREIENEYQQRKNAIDKQESNWKRDNVKAGIATGDNGLTDDQRLTLDDARRQNLSSRQKAEKEAYQAEFDAMQSDVLRIVSYAGKTKELREQQWKDEQAAIDKMKEGSDKRIRQIRLNYEKEIAEINEQEALLRAAQGGRLTKEQSQGFVQSYANAHGRMENGVRDVEGSEVAKGKKKLEALLQEYQSYDQRRRDIDSKYNEDMAAYNLELSRLKESGADTSDVESSISARTEKYKEEIASLEEDILRASDFYSKLFGDVSEKGYKALSDFYAQAKDVLSGAKVGSGGVSLSVPAKDENGKFVKKQVTVTVAEFERMQKRVKEIQKDLEKGNPFKAFKTSYDDLLKAIKKDGDISGALKDFNAKGKELTSTIRGWGDSLGAVFGDRFAQSINEMMTFVDGAMDMGTGIGQIFSGDIVGGITNTLSGLFSIISMFKSWKEKMEEMKREWYIAEIETNRAIRERNEEYAANQSLISDIIKDVELLNWLVEKGYAKPTSISVWEAQSEQLSQLEQDLKSEKAVYDELWNNLQGSDAHWEWGNSLNGGSVTHSLRGMSAEQIELYYNQEKLSDAARDYYEAWVDSGKTVEELVQNIEECYSTMREMVMGVSFDSFLSNAKDALKEMRSDISKLGEFTEDTLAEAVLNAFMYHDLSKVLQPLYNELSEAFIDGTADKDYLSDWRERFEQAMQEAGERLDAMADASGIDLDSGGTPQSGKSGAFTSMSQEQAGKLEGLFVSGQMHWSSMDDKLTDVTRQMDEAGDHLRQIATNTGSSAQSLVEIKEDIKKMIRDGLKVK